MIKRDNQSVSVLCRGDSLEYIDKLPICDTTVLVNSFHSELQYDDVDKYVRKHIDVIHMVSPGSEFYNMIELEDYKKYNFTKIVLPYIKECVPMIKAYRDIYLPMEWKKNEKGEMVRTKFRTIPSADYAYSKPVEDSFLVEIRNRHGEFLPVENMSDDNKKDMVETRRYGYTSPTCGMDSILYAVNDLKAKNVSIIGLDFYDKTGYYTDSHGETSANKAQSISRGEDPEMMKEFFINFVKKHSDVNFYLVTKSKLSHNIKNLKVEIV